jgi:diguanylate cyclase (GGDEF)-like protein/PAS domain S-box-containing protein
MDASVSDRVGRGEGLFRLVVEQARDLISVLDATGTVLYASPSHVAALGYEPSALVGMNALELVHRDDLERARAALAESLAGVSRAEQYRLRHREGGWVVVEGMGAVLAPVGAEPAVIVVTSRDVTARVASERRLRAQNAVTEALAQAATTSQAAQRIIAALCEHLDWKLGVLWRVDAGSCTLRCLEAWHPAGMAAAERFAIASRRMAFAPDVGLPGLTWTARRPQWIADVADDERVVRRAVAARIGMHGAVAFPVMLGHEVLGVLEFFDVEVREPEPELVELMATIGGQLGQFIDRKQAEEDLRISEARKGAVVEAALDCVVSIDEEGRVIEFNPAAEATFGYSRGQVLGRAMVDLIVPPSLRDRHRIGFERYLTTGTSSILGKRLEMTAVRADGSVFPVELTVTRVDLPGPPQFTAYLRDITEHVQGQRALRHLAAIVESSTTAIIGTAPDGNIESWNAGAERLYGYAAEEVIGRPIAMLIPEDQAAEWSKIMQPLARGEGVAEYDTVRVTKTGERVDVSLAVSPIKDPQGRVVGASAIARDITDRKRDETRIAFLAHHDALTGLPNRATLQEHLDLALTRAARHAGGVAMLYLDLDNFKLINDSLGHQAGDDLLCQVAARLNQITRTTDLVARQGGDEFLILLADLPPGGESEAQPTPIDIAVRIAGKVAHALSQPFLIGGNELPAGSSIGISAFPTDASTSEELLKHADAAMYEAKRTGRGDYRVYTNGHRDARDELSLISRLRRALDRDELVLHYQPLIDLHQTRTSIHNEAAGAPAPAIVGVEALIRWNDRDRQRLPHEFLPLADQAGLMAPITDWVLNHACEQAGRWHAAGLELDVALNLPLSHLWRPRAVERTIEQVESHHVNPRRLILEIPESVAMANPDRTEQTLQDLHQYGFQLAIDDFGTGYSSLSRLTHIPVTILKIDRSFINAIPTDTHACALVTTIIQLAHNLGLRPLAEGVETPAQHRFLIEHDCELGQGYRFSPALPAARIDEMLMSQHGASSVEAGRNQAP